MKFNHQSEHLALRLPEIVGHILSYLIVPFISDDIQKGKTYQHIYSCLYVNSLWNDCATRWMWRNISFDDTQSEYEAFMKFVLILSKKNNLLGTAADLSIANSMFDSCIYNQKGFNRKKTIHGQVNAKILTHLKTILDGSFDSLQKDTGNYERYRKSFRSLTLRKIKDKSINEPLEILSRFTNQLEKIDIYICDYLADSSIHLLIQHNYPNTLTYLSLAGCNKITDEAIISVANHCARLEHLDLRACGLISDKSIQVIATKCRNLYHLNVGRVRDREKITITSIDAIAKHTRVGVLGLAGCDMTDECLISLAKHRGPLMERISVNNCYRITNKSIQAYIQYCPNLSVFEMKECHWIDDWESVAELVQRKVLLTLCDQQNRACAEWARQRGRVMEVKAPVK
ncbi:hypothetical protein BDB01DRAFT_806217 [Pilobolus umbonatus]|nr:hypothetical protein BDB01DRAFT_806217 [Pilobolus umbonatus]